MKITANRAQVGVLFQKLEDLQGNRDQILGNESSNKTSPDRFSQNPMSLSVKAALSVGLSKNDEIAALQNFATKMQDQWGMSVANADVIEKMSGGELYALNKTLELARLGRTPAQVSEGFVRAAGTVDGESIAARDIFYQRYEPVGEPTKKVVLISPGFQESGRDFADLAADLSEKGHTVIVMDHQWAGYSEGAKGGIDRGFGVARDTAQMAAFANESALASFGDEGSVMLLGNSMGAGPGVLGALLLNESDRISLDKGTMPKALDALLIAPYLGATPSLTNNLLQAAAKIPMLNRIKAPLAGLPDLTDDDMSAHLAAQNAVIHDTRAQLSAFETVNDDLKTLNALVQSSSHTGKLTLVHSREDTLAKSEHSTTLSEALGAKVHFIEGDHHVLHNEKSPRDLISSLVV